MRYITYTYVDALTGVAIDQAPAKNGPVQPSIPSLQFEFALESEYPTLTPTHYGTCSDDSDIDVSGVLAEVSEAQYQAAQADEQGARLDKARRQLREAATAKRWAVMTGGVSLPNGVSIGTEIDDQNRITSVVANAALAGLTDASEVDFKAASGWVTITIAEVKAIAGIVGQFVQACYTAERAHHAQIDAIVETEELSVYEQLAAHDLNTGWPAN